MIMLSLLNELIGLALLELCLAPVSAQYTLSVFFIICNINEGSVTSGPPGRTPAFYDWAIFQRGAGTP